MRSTPTTPSSHRLRRGLPGYLILFATHAFASQRQYPSRWPPSPPVFLSPYLRISPLLGEFRHPLRYSSSAVSGALPRLSRGLSHPTCKAAYTRFTPNNSEQRLHLCITAAAGTELAGASSSGTVKPEDVSLRVFVPASAYNPKTFITRGVAASGFRPLRKIPHCCLP